MIRDEALDLLHKYIKNENLRRHCYAVEAVMKALAKHFKEDEETWGIAGLIHDADYEITKDNAKQEHTKLLLNWLKDLKAEGEIYDAVATHAWQFVEGAPEPKTEMQWSLYCCDELTGLIVAIALVKPDKKLASVSVDSVMKKWNKKDFAAGVDRKQIEMCETKLGFELKDFIQITLEAMQGISEKLDL